MSLDKRKSTIRSPRLSADTTELLVMAALLVGSIAFFSLLAPGFLSAANFGSMAVQLPELGLLSLAMFVPIISGGLNLSVTFTANIAGLMTAWLVQGALADTGVLGTLLAMAAGLAGAMVA